MNSEYVNNICYPEEKNIFSAFNTCSFENLKVVITGSTGFKGSWLTETLINFGSFVKGYSLKDEKKSFYESFVNFRKVKNSYGDISDYKKVYLV